MDERDDEHGVATRLVEDTPAPDFLEQVSSTRSGAEDVTHFTVPPGDAP